MAQMNWDEMRKEAEKSGGFAPHPIGVFRFKVIEASLRKGTKGNGQILARLENQDAGPNNGKTVLNNMSPLKNDGTPNGMFFQQLGALGFAADDPLFAQLSKMDEAQGLAYIATNILGREAVCEITHRDWNGIRDNVKSMKPVGAAPAVGGVPANPAAAALEAIVAEALVPVVPAVPPVPEPVPVLPAPVPVAPAPVPVVPAPVPVATEPVPVVPAPVPVATEPVPVVPAPVPVATEPVPVAPAPTAAQVPQAETPVAPVQALEATPAPTTEEAVVAQIPTPPVVPIPTPPDRPF